MLFPLFPRLLTAALALSGIVSALPSRKEERSVSVTPGGGRVLVDGGGVYMRSTRLQDGSLVGGYAAQDGANHVMRVAKSTNNGGSWTHIGDVASGPSATHDIDNASIVQLPSGRIMFAFRNHDRTSSGSYTYYRITLCFSDDGGYTWSYLTQIDERAANGVNGLWEPFLRVSNAGTLQVFYSTENNGGDQDNVMRFSNDGGGSWSGMRDVSGQGLTSRDGMTGVAKIDNNGNLICVFENTESGHFSINSVISQDDGFTWNTRSRVYTAAADKDAGAPQVVNVGGRLVAGFMTNENDNIPAIDGGRMKVLVSEDGGQSWGPATETGPTGSHWEGMQELDSAHFLALYALDGQGLVSQVWQL